ncbi:hypothetical protein RRG08_060949 [Elysia crispata]|uniref:Uncharacterized protein n=1 Tax=Elysia crispata TaxID=231223 RepID=A0AAE1E4P4_9GAST|nr:hypothetical protein RRG08_060949 [Elysia crispata]
MFIESSLCQLCVTVTGNQTVLEYREQIWQSVSSGSGKQSVYTLWSATEQLYCLSCDIFTKTSRSSPNTKKLTKPVDDVFVDLSSDLFAELQRDTVNKKASTGGGNIIAAFPPLLSAAELKTSGLEPYTGKLTEGFWGGLVEKICSALFA